MTKQDETGPAPAENEAIKIARFLLREAPGIENLTIVYSPVGKPTTVLTSTTGHSPVMWVLGAMEYVRYHCYTVLDHHRVKQVHEDLTAMLAQDEKPDKGGLN